MLPSVEIYLECLVKTVVQRCASCNADICMACGEETCESVQSKTPIIKRKEDEEDASFPMRLFHCPELQAIILGVGLIHLEQLSEEQRKMMQVVCKAEKSGSPSKKPKFSPQNSFDGGKASVAPKKRPACGVGFGGSDSGETLNWRGELHTLDYQSLMMRAKKKEQQRHRDSRWKSKTRLFAMVWRVFALFFPTLPETLLTKAIISPTSPPLLTCEDVFSPLPAVF